MLAMFSIILPIFALILAGWVARKTDALGLNATRELNRFVVYLALPALLFDIVANAHWIDIWQPAFVATFGLGVGIIFILTVLVAIYRSRHLADAAVDGLNAAYANTGFIGFPLALAVLGTESLVPTMIATIITVCILFAIALILVEVGIQTERKPRKMILNVLVSLAKNPLLIAPLIGFVFLITGFKVPAPAETFLKLLGGAAPPCALVALGLFLAEKRVATDSSKGTIFGLITMKLIGQPLLTWALAVHVFHLSQELTDVAVLIAALPTGTGPFMVAEFYGREGGITSRTILFSTVFSLITITAYLGWR